MMENMGIQKTKKKGIFGALCDDSSMLIFFLIVILLVQGCDIFDGQDESLLFFTLLLIILLGDGGCF